MTAGYRKPILADSGVTACRTHQVDKPAQTRSIRFFIHFHP